MVPFEGHESLILASRLVSGDLLATFGVCVCACACTHTHVSAYVQDKTRFKHACSLSQENILTSETLANGSPTIQLLLHFFVGEGGHGFKEVFCKDKVCQKVNLANLSNELHCH